MSNSLQPHGLYRWNSPGQYTGVGSLSLLQGIFPTQGLNPGLPHCRWLLYQLSHRGAQEYWSGQPVPSPVDLLDPGIEPVSPALQADSLPTELSGKPQKMMIEKITEKNFLLLKFLLWLVLWLSNTPLYILMCTTASLAIHLLMDIQVALTVYILLNFQFLYASVLDSKLPKFRYICFLDTDLQTSACNQLLSNLFNVW